MVPTHGTSSDPLDLPIQFVKGIGPKRFAALEKIGISTLRDLLFYVPRRYLDRTSIVKIADLRRHATNESSAPVALSADDEINIRRDYTVVGDVRSFRVVGTGRGARFVLVLGDATGTMQCVWFGGVQFWKRAFRIGEILAVSGRPALYAGVLQIVHPDIDRIAARDDDAGGLKREGGPAEKEERDWAALLHSGGLVPLYPSGQELQRVGLESAGFRRVIHKAIERYARDIADELPQALLQQRLLCGLSDAIRAVHFPQRREDLNEGLQRLKYDELFLFQLKLALRRAMQEKHTVGIAFDTRSALARKLVDRLPFALTGAQRKVIREIAADMALPHPMNRLLQGDVGSGKTVVALLAMLIAVDNGCQAAFLAPTEILAEQHFRTLAVLADGLGLNMQLLVGGSRSKRRRQLRADLGSGALQIVVGTHALLESDVTFSKLGLVVIDEQHRFGVLQRAAIREKGESPDVLVMTATPIPRTLSLTLYGDLDVSIINEMPKDRKPIRTTISDETSAESVHTFVRDQIQQGRQAYFVYPLIEESEALELKAATLHYEHLQNAVFPEFTVGLLHGRMASEEKDAVMQAFKAGTLQILVATTVIEVGIDVPNATVMVIENAERFGLSQLHQLRGRVGRGADQSYCILVTRRWIAQRARCGGAQDDLSLDQQRAAEQRLAAMAKTTDGFAIAEMDLQLRGPGDYFGTRQSGVPEFRVADILLDTALLDAARADAFAMVAHDPSLSSPDHVRLARYVRAHFEAEVKLMDAG